eukprot:CAMPEP_0113691278 /NCGR_PEP_ID=MMETSP0038_2-20120614/18329_1 /TAXON_ID=2898 /ORGANISM="Cryptomonas paramecium" /LENGTH=257 /DNA_ID=CAMNT_0000612839 /DNA_START=469 /DNA_END=1239 /DNA_ORIENTATION=- /assembly_acc=CAM_ASM_000170
MTGSSSYMNSTSSPVQSKIGDAFLQFKSGEQGKNFEVSMKVLSLSVEEDWITGVSYIPVTYSQPYARKSAYFPSSISSYAAALSTASSNQPYQTVPWVAQFVGCCRVLQTLESDQTGAWDFNLTATVDLTDAVGSPRLVTLPVHWIPAPTVDTDDSAEAEVEVCAVLRTPGMLRKSGGTLNFPSDDNQPVALSWQILGPYSDRARLAPPVAAAAPNCRTVLVKSAKRRFLSSSGDSAVLVNNLAVAASLGPGCPWGD